jgi:redox-sensing transcriptional repressor
VARVREIAHERPIVGSMGVSRRRRIPEATVARLPIYLRILAEQSDLGTVNVSSEELAELAGVNAAKVRKDLSYLGSYGTRGVGYEVEYLIYEVRRELGLTHDWPVVIVGAGNLGQALAGYGGFAERGFPVAGIVDIDEAKIGTLIGGVRVRGLDDLPAIVRARQVSIGVVATPAWAGPDAPARRRVTVRKVDLAVELQILSYYEQRRANAASSSSPAALAGPRRGASA